MVVLEDISAILSGDSCVLMVGAVRVVVLRVIGVVIVIGDVDSLLSGDDGTAVLRIVVMEISEDVFIVVVVPEVDSHEYVSSLHI